MLAWVPNSLTLMRLILGPVILGCVWHHAFIPATLLYMIACATDWFDGFLARHFHCTSKFGACIDPVADKMLTFCSYFAMYKDLPWLFWLVVGRDFAILCGAAMILLRKLNVPIAPLWISKVHTSILLVLPYVWLLQHVFSYSFGGTLLLVLESMIVLTTILSSVGYARVLYGALKRREKCSHP